MPHKQNKKSDTLKKNKVLPTQIEQYRNHEIVSRVEDVTKKILEARNSNKHRDKFFPALINELGLKIGAEIGVDTGAFSEHLLNSKLDKLYCIDHWPDDFGSDYRPGFYDSNGNKRMQEAIKKLEKFGDRVIFIRDKSINAALKIPDGSIDFGYIDGNHSLEGIYIDVYTWIRKIRIGGIIAGHDYKDGTASGMKNYWGEQLPYRIKTVVDNFCDQYGFKLNIVGGRILSWFFVKN